MLDRLALSTVALVALLLTKSLFAAPDTSTPTLPWPATDGLGRSLPLAEDVGPPRPDRFVGIFYFLWHTNRAGGSPHWKGPYDIARILERDPDALAKPDSPLWGPVGRYHYWGEPLYGYYQSDDPWVLRRHAQALADAGIDTLIFDTTNAVTYRSVYLRLCEVFREVRNDGGRTPQIAFMVNTRAGETASALYRDLYQKGLYEELWFRWRGRPLLICDPAQASEAVRAFFTLRRAHWPFTMVNTERAWHWEAAYPQPYGYVDDPKRPEQVNVSVAQNLRRSDGKVTNMSDGNARGRSFHGGAVDTSPGAVNHGYNFQEQWKRVFELAPPFVMITGWNEWIAGRWKRPGKPIVFVDQYDQEYSRDIEYARVGHLDHYYWQMVANVRRYKGAPKLPAASAKKAIDIDGDFSQWAEVRPEFSDYVGETAPRDHPGAGGLHYRNTSGRNDIVACKVARDDARVAFYLRARAPIQPADELKGLWLLLDVDQKPATGWEGYDFIVGRSPEGEGRLSLERHVEAWRWEKVGSVGYRLEGKELHLVLPRAALGLPASGPLELDFKWIDNAQRPGDILDVYTSGDVAPEGRFRFRFRGAE